MVDDEAKVGGCDGWQHKSKGKEVGKESTWYLVQWDIKSAGLVENNIQQLS